MTITLLLVVIPLGLLALMGAATVTGFGLGARRRRRRQEEQAEIGPVLGAMLGLLGLLLGFAFSGATSRYIDRDVIILHEANAIGTAYLRADLLDEPARASLKNLLRMYAADRLAMFREPDLERAAPIADRLASHQARIWALASEQARASPHLTLALLSPINEIFDVLGERNAASHRHLPTMVLALLILCAALSLGTVGYHCGLHAKGHVATAGPLALLVAAALWITIDMDYPRVGVVKLRGEPLVELVESLSIPPAPTPE